MFYSHDILGRKSPLGAIWTMAHGRKLSKCKILGINVSDVCAQIMQPDVPHSLRLQGILIGGVVIVFNKQQIYLLEDLQDMLRKVKYASAPEAATVAAVNTVLQKGRDRARAEAITLAMDLDGDMEHMLLAPDAHQAANANAAGGRRAQQQQQGAERRGKRGSRAGGEGDADPDGVGGEGGGAGLDRADPDGLGFGFGDGDFNAAEFFLLGGGRGAAGGSGVGLEDLFVVPTLPPPSGTEGTGSKGPLSGQRRAAAAGTGTTGTGATGSLHHTDDGIDPNDLFEAPDLQLPLDGGEEQEDDGEEAYLLALGGFNRRAAKGTAAAAQPLRDTTNTRGGTTHATHTTGNGTHGTTRTASELYGKQRSGATATATASAGDGLDGLGVAADGTTLEMFEVPTDLFDVMEGLHEGTQDQQQQAAGGRLAQQLLQRQAARAARRRDTSRDAAGDRDGEEDDEEEGDEEWEGVDRQLLREQPERSGSAVPLPSVGQPPEHEMPPSPLAESLFGADADGPVRPKRRRTSDEDNDSVATADEALAQLQAQQQGAAEGKKASRRGRLGAELANNRAGRRRAGPKVTLDPQEEIQIRGTVYRDWTLDTSALLQRPGAQHAPGLNRRGRQLREAAAAGFVLLPTSAAAALPHGRAAGTQEQRLQHLAASQGVGYAFMAATPLDPSQGAEGAVRAGRGVAAVVWGSAASRPMGRLAVGGDACAALVGALVAGDVEGAVAAAMRGPAAALGGMGMGWAPALAEVVEAASASDGGAPDEDDEAAPSPDVRVAKRRRGIAAPPLHLEPTAAANRSNGGAAGTRLGPLPLASAGKGSSYAASERVLTEEGDEDAGNPFRLPEQLLHQEDEELLAGVDADQEFMVQQEPEFERQESDFGDMEGVEMERLRKAATPSGDGAFPAGHAARAALGLTPGDSGGALAAAAAAGRRGSRATTASGSSLGRESEDGAPSDAPGGGGGRRLRSAGDGELLRWGVGALEDLLPAIEEGGLGAWEEYPVPDPSDTLGPKASSGTGTAGGRRSARLGAATATATGTQPLGTLSGVGGSGSGPSALHGSAATATGTGSGAGGMFGSLGGFQLVETCDWQSQAVEGAARVMQAGAVSKHTRTVMAIYRKHLMDIAATNAANAAGGAAGDAEPPAPPSVSFFSLASQLTRSEAVRLFYQTLVTHTMGVVCGQQDEPYGDIIITPGRYMA